MSSDVIVEHACFRMVGGPLKTAARGGIVSARVMGIAEEHAAFGQPVQIGRLDLGMTAETANPVVQVIERTMNKTLGRCAGAAREREPQTAQQKDTSARMILMEGT